MTESPSLLLQRAADKLEGLAATATPGPWRWSPEKHHRQPGTSYFSEAVFVGEPGRAAVCVATTGQSDDPPSMCDAAWIATMSPAVAAPLVAWLRAAARRLGSGLSTFENGEYWIPRETMEALDFARLVLGEVSGE